MQVNQVRAGAILSYVSMAVSTILSLVYAPIMKGQLGTSEYGVYGSVGPIIAYLLLLSMGLGSAYMRYYSQAKVAQDRRTMAKLNGMFLVTYTVLGLVLLVLGFTLAAHPQNVFGAKWTEEELALGAKLLRSAAVPSGTIIGLDKNYALEQICGSEVVVEYDKLIDRQLERAAITSISGFAKLFTDAAKVLKV